MFFGLARGNIIGGFIGFTIGYIIEEALNGKIEIAKKDIFKEAQYHYTAYQSNLLALISEVVKADGYISRDEVYYIKNYLLNQFGSIYSNLMLKTLKLNVDKNFDIKAVCNDLKNSLDLAQAINLVSFLYGITVQNGSINPNEKLIIQAIAKHIGLSAEDYENIVNTNQRKKTNQARTTRTQAYNPYKVLETTKSASDSEVKKAYRQMVLKYHPDKSDAEDKIANEKFSAISEAYHIIKEQRNIK